MICGMDKLATRTNQDLGKTLLEAARESRRKAFQESVVGIVENLLDSKQQIEAEIERSKGNLDLVVGRLEAIEAGGFDVDLQKHQIIYTDKKLNRPYNSELDMPKFEDY